MKEYCHETIAAIVPKTAVELIAFTTRNKSKFWTTSSSASRFCLHVQAIYIIYRLLGFFSWYSNILPSHLLPH